ncbi:MAG TPA: DUF3857 domain-containing protein [Methylomirabilota bacterium]|nr:DUF3857 domain-containing protein [Methylomirabilota bacterium]
MNAPKHRRRLFPAAALFPCLILLSGQPARAQAQQAPAQPGQTKEAEERDVVELLETRVRFASDGTSRREVHAIVRIRTEAAARQFSRLSFDYNRGFEHIDFSLVRITHAGGGTADILPSAVTEQVLPAAANAPDFADLRRKSVRILGLQPGDLLEYRVVTQVEYSPFAPDFFFAHNFAREDVARETLEIELPAASEATMHLSAQARAYATERRGAGTDERIAHTWRRPVPAKTGEAGAPGVRWSPAGPAEPDVSLATFSGWAGLLMALQKLLPPGTPEPGIAAKAEELTKGMTAEGEKLETLYQFTSQRVATVAVPLGATGLRTRRAAEVLAAGYGTEEEKVALLRDLAAAAHIPAEAVFPLADASYTTALPVPGYFSAVLLHAELGATTVWLDPSREVAPYRMIAANLRGKPALRTAPESNMGIFERVPLELPFPAMQRLGVTATVRPDGSLHAKVSYTLRGDDELLLREAFHKAKKESWSELGAALAQAGGFRGRIARTDASDPSKTDEAFRVEYELTQDRFVDWTKAAAGVRVPMPVLRLPDAPASPGAGEHAAKIEFGTAVEASAECWLELPPGTEVHAPAGISVARDYATYSSEYKTEGTKLHVSRVLRFILREIPGERAADYAAFYRAVESDENQAFAVSAKPAAAPGGGATRP